MVLCSFILRSHTRDQVSNGTSHQGTSTSVSPFPHATPQKWFTRLTYFFKFRMRLQSHLMGDTEDEQAEEKQLPVPVDFDSLVIAWLATA